MRVLAQKRKPDFPQHTVLFSSNQTTGRPFCSTSGSFLGGGALSFCFSFVPSLFFAKHGVVDKVRIFSFLSQSRRSGSTLNNLIGQLVSFEGEPSLV